MGLGEKLSQELIYDILLEIFPKEEIKEKPSPVIRYNRQYLQELRPIPKTEPIIEKFSNPNFNSLNTRKIRTNLPKPTKNYRGRNSCHFCGETGHIKRSCVKKQEFDDKTRNRFQPTKNLFTSISFDQEFLETARGLIPLRNPEISIEELIKIRTIVNTLIYFRPASEKISGHCANIY